MSFADLPIRRRDRLRAIAAAIAALTVIGVALAVLLAPAGPADAIAGDSSRGLIAGVATSGQPPPVPLTAPQVHLFPAMADLKGRAEPRLDAKVVKENAYPKGSQVPVVCQATGGPAFGSTVWDKTVDGFWVTDSYVRTGAKGFSPDVPRCDDQP